MGGVENLFVREMRMRKDGVSIGHRVLVLEKWSYGMGKVGRNSFASLMCVGCPLFAAFQSCYVGHPSTAPPMCCRGAA